MTLVSRKVSKVLRSYLEDAHITAYDAEGRRMGDGLYPVVEFTRTGIVERLIYTKRFGVVVSPVAWIAKTYCAGAGHVAVFALEAK